MRNAWSKEPKRRVFVRTASKVSKIDVERAHTVFLSGKGFLDESNYDKAISYFKDAYSIDCSVHGILPIIATAYERKGDKAEAIHALGEYILRVPNTPDREVIERRIRNLREQLAQEKPTATAVCRRRSLSVMTDTRAVSFITFSQRLDRPGSASRMSCGKITSRMVCGRLRPRAVAASYCPAAMPRKAERKTSLA